MEIDLLKKIGLNASKLQQMFGKDNVDKLNQYDPAVLDGIATQVANRLQSSSIFAQANQNSGNNQNGRGMDISEVESMLKSFRPQVNTAVKAADVEQQEKIQEKNASQGITGINNQNNIFMNANSQRVNKPDNTQAVNKTNAGNNSALNLNNTFSVPNNAHQQANPLEEQAKEIRSFLSKAGMNFSTAQIMQQIQKNNLDNEEGSAKISTLINGNDVFRLMSLLQGPTQNRNVEASSNNAKNNENGNEQNKMMSQKPQANTSKNNAQADYSVANGWFPASYSAQSTNGKITMTLSDGTQMSIAEDGKQGKVYYNSKTGEYAFDGFENATITSAQGNNNFKVTNSNSVSFKAPDKPFLNSAAGNTQNLNEMFNKQGVQIPQNANPNANLNNVFDTNTSSNDEVAKLLSKLNIDLE